jgi:hypothetical protein
MGLHRLAQQQMDGLNKRAQAERFFQPGAHALRHSLFKLRLLLRIVSFVNASEAWL